MWTGGIHDNAPRRLVTSDDLGFTTQQPDLVLAAVRNTQQYKEDINIDEWFIMMMVQPQQSTAEGHTPGMPQATMSRPQVGIERLPTRRLSNEPRESMNCKSCRKRKVRRIGVPGYHQPVQVYILHGTTGLTWTSAIQIKCNRLRPSCEACQVFQCPCIYGMYNRHEGCLAWFSRKQRPRSLTIVRRCRSQEERSQDGCFGSSAKEGRRARAEIEGKEGGRIGHQSFREEPRTSA